jgi:hypothetical protein
MPTSSPPQSISKRAGIIQLPGAKRVLGLVLALAPLFADIAMAGTSVLTAQASVNTNCAIVVAPVVFGTYDPIATNASSGANLNASGSITITCVKGAAPTMASAGAHFGQHSANGFRDDKLSRHTSYVNLQTIRQAQPALSPARTCGEPSAPVCSRPLPPPTGPREPTIFAAPPRRVRTRLSEPIPTPWLRR